MQLQGIFDLSPGGLQAQISNLEYNSLQSHNCYETLPVSHSRSVVSALHMSPLNQVHCKQAWHRF